MRIIRAYLNWLWRSVNAHGIHSPFLFACYGHLKGNSAPKFNNREIEDIRKAFKRNATSIPQIDLGAGSRKNKGKHIKISAIAHTALKPKRDARRLQKLISFLQPNCILELGTSLGISTLYMAKAAPHAQIHTIEGNPHIRKEAQKLFQDNNQIHSHEGDFDQILQQILPGLQPDIWFIDGNHTREATIRYFEMAMQHAQKDICLIFDDIYWSKEMEEAWNYIINSNHSSLSLDLFHLGIVFKKEGLTKEHYYIR